MEPETKLISKLWLLASSLSIVEAALLLIEVEPQGVSQFVNGWDDHEKPVGFIAARNSIASALRAEEIQGEINFTYTEGMEELDHATGMDYAGSFVFVPSLREWLVERGFTTGFFFSNGLTSGFRDAGHPRYSPKLAAIVEAWESYDLESSELGTPKQRIMKWLRLNANRFDLTNEEGSPREKVIDELAKVANWAPRGGAPRLVSEKQGQDKIQYK